MILKVNIVVNHYLHFSRCFLIMKAFFISFLWYVLSKSGFNKYSKFFLFFASWLSSLFCLAAYIANSCFSCSLVVWDLLLGPIFRLTLPFEIAVPKLWMASYWGLPDNSWRMRSVAIPAYNSGISVPTLLMLMKGNEACLLPNVLCALFFLILIFYSDFFRTSDS